MTLIQVGIENDRFTGRSQAWLLDFPGCFAYGKDANQAVLNVPHALGSFREWALRHNPACWLADLGDFDVRVVETWDIYAINEQFDLDENGYTMESWFLNDWKPLTDVQVQQALQMLGWSRADLLAITVELPGSILDQTYPNERWSIRGILRHIANADWWYLDRLGRADAQLPELPEDVFERLREVRSRQVAVLPQLVGIHQVVGLQGEIWSPRKLVRRSLWHELDHINHICKLL
jgi:uncharacterized damage-inducible protein DinB